VDLIHSPTDEPLAQQWIAERRADGHDPDRSATSSDPFDDLEPGVDIGPDLPSSTEAIVQIDHRTIE